MKKESLKSLVEELERLEKERAKWKGWGWQVDQTGSTPKPESVGTSDSTKEGVMAPSATAKLTRVIFWRSGKWAVVAGPFPQAFFRSETRDTVEKAIKLDSRYCVARPETTLDTQYAKVLLSDIAEILAGENEWGKISP